MLADAWWVVLNDVFFASLLRRSAVNKLARLRLYCMALPIQGGVFNAKK
jgi:hypothetical protein